MIKLRNLVPQRECRNCEYTLVLGVEDGGSLALGTMIRGSACPSRGHVAGVGGNFWHEEDTKVLSVFSLYLTGVGVYVGPYVCVRTHTNILSTSRLSCCRVFQCVPVCCSALPVCCSVMPCVAVWCWVLACVAVCCHNLHCVAWCCRVIPCVAMWCLVLPCDAVSCHVMQRVAVISGVP